jgi:hypothetical protein
MSSWKYSRRRVLSRLGMGAALLPTLNARRSAWGATVFPKRLVIMSSPNGVIPDAFWPRPTADGSLDIDPNGLCASLIPHKDDLIFVGGLALNSFHDDPHGKSNNGHGAWTHLLTGVTGPTVFEMNGNRCVGGTRSLDQVIGDAIVKKSPKVPFHALTLGVRTHKGTLHQNRMVWQSRGVPVTPNDDPYDIYNRIVPNANKTGTDITALVRRKKSVLDYVGRELDGFAKTLGTDDRQRIDAHLTALRQVERQFDPANAQPVGVCQPVALGSKLNLEANDNQPTLQDLQMKMIATALACDVTRVATLQLTTGSANDVVFSWLGKEFTLPSNGDFQPIRNHHEITHAFQNKPNPYRPLKFQIESWYISQLAKMIGYLKSYREGSGTLLDNTVIMFTNGMSHGGSHSTAAIPTILAGRAGGYFRTGRYVRYGGFHSSSQFNTGSGGTNGAQYLPHNRLLVSVANAMELPITWFGDPKYGGPLEGLR